MYFSVTSKFLLEGALENSRQLTKLNLSRTGVSSKGRTYIFICTAFWLCIVSNVVMFNKIKDRWCGHFKCNIDRFTYKGFLMYCQILLKYCFKRLQIWYIHYTKKEITRWMRNHEIFWKNITVFKQICNITATKISVNQKSSLI